MTRKDYELIAGVIGRMDATSTREQVAYDFADALATTNPRFDRDRFLRACGVA